MSTANDNDTGTVAEELPGRARRFGVSTSAGEISVLDFGGSGVDTLMIHSPGFCGESLALVAAAMLEHCRIFSIELPGHGQAPMSGMSSHTFWPLIPQVVAGLGLERPVLVGFDLSGFYVTAAAAENPGLASAVVSVGGWCLRTREETAEFLEFITADDVMDDVAERMMLGAIAPDDDAMQAILLTLARNASNDFLIADDESRFASRISGTVQRRDDGTLVRLPTVETMRLMHDLSIDDAIYPEKALLKRIDVPYKIVLTTDGMDQELIYRALEVSERLAHVHVSLVQAGNNPQMAHPEPIGEAITRVVAHLS